ncbi:protein ANKUB1-like [Hydractinia symbiolongicarpus]|uniref:protein ANKUB1-like n=1 Tax=Hydractinia symbiolongicarpus TaxID=13093 RepID=UPI00254A13CC|nr:protein ANKUB1-like [Hydractinia symbiolongicarpus]
MRIVITFERERFAINVLSTDTVAVVKQLIEKEIQIFAELCSHNCRSQLQLYFADNLLKDDTLLHDLGVISGSIIRCKYVETPVADICIDIPFLSKRIELDSFDNTATVSNLRTILQNNLGIPVGVFKLLTREGLELYDVNTLEYYKLKRGSAITLELFLGVEKVLLRAINGDILQTMRYISEFKVDPKMNRFLMRVALFISAHYDHVKLASFLLRKGIRSEDPPGIHPSRTWCSEMSHPDIQKCPVHQAAQQGNINCLKLFLRHSSTCAITRDGYHNTAMTYAARNLKFDCWKLILVEQFKKNKRPGFTHASQIHLLRWLRQARDATHNPAPNDFLLSVDGYNPQCFMLNRRRCTLKTADTNNNKLPVLQNSTFDGENGNGLAPKDVNDNLINEPRSLILPDIFQSRRKNSKSFKTNYLETTVFKQTGLNVHNLAKKCLEFGQKFENKPWRHQLEIALRKSKSDICGMKYT